ncbi:anthranilate synthase beta subunit 2, chloroplastic-like isoform X2 [Phoenix dactylifera]|uniref:anthranilate synthase n=1 Tax=Phoenix dactylifera TaxID=42345 RepID=A0A8B7CAU5_PHODC|nr:anthranilate synthase beta subunit 2, chloroplastic-like isoform X2 [Phoenix dactylifera]
MASPALLSLSPKHFLAPQTLARPRPLPLIPTAATPLFRPPIGRGGLALGRCPSIVPGATAVSGIENDRVLAVNRREEKPIIVIDNYDSFTYNICQYMGELGANFEVYRNDELTVDDLKRKNPKGVLISPGPGSPQDSGISLQTVLELGPSIPLFGVCMGLQCIGEAFGGKIVRSPSGVRHGKSSLVYYDEKQEDNLFYGLPNPFTAGRYHSLVIDNDSFPSDALEITAWTKDGLIMAARHKKYRHIQGVQFHPESIITSEGKTLVLNFIKLMDKLDSDFRAHLERKILA